MITDHGCRHVWRVESPVTPRVRTAVRLLAVVATVAVIGLANATPAFAQWRRLPPGAAILGQVVDAQSGRGLTRAVISIESPHGRYRAVTDDRGRFLFPGLPTGDYQISATRAGYLPGRFGQRRPSGSGATISLIDGQWVAGAEIALWRPAVISGSVRDDRHDPVVGLTVRAYRRDRRGGHSALTEAAQARTDDTGTYRLTGLVPGDYLVGLSHRRSDTPEGTDDLELPIAPQYYPGADRVTGALPITVEAGGEMGGIGFMVPVATPLSVSGRIDPHSLPDRDLHAVQLRLVTPDDASTTEAPEQRTLAVISPDADGHFRFDHLAPGTYTIEALLSTPAPPDPALESAPPLLATHWGREDVTLGQTSLEDVRVILQPGLDVAGHGRPGLMVHFDPMFDAPGMREVTTRIGADGTFRSGPTLWPGRYLIRVSGIPSGSGLRGVTAGGVDTADEGLDLSSGFARSDLTVELTDRNSSVSGTVRAAGPFGDPLATVLLFPDALGAVSARRHRSARVRTNGTFVLADVPPGRYRIIAIDDADADDWMTADRLLALRRRAAPLDVREGEAKVIELRRQSVR